jgi:hypothetical protein
MGNCAPTSRHTYSGLSYDAAHDVMFAYGGSKADAGFCGNDVWTLDMPTLGTSPQYAWTKPANGIPNAYTNLCDEVSDYDPNTQKVLLHDTQTLWSYDVATDKVTNLGGGAGYANDYPNAIVDPLHKIFFIIGNNQLRGYDMSGAPPYPEFNWTAQTTGCAALIGANAPGLAWDSVQNKIVSWFGGDSVVVFDPGTKSCTTVTNPNGPGSPTGTGTYGRFRYFPALNVFALVNNWNQNAYVLRLTNGTPPPPPPPPSISPCDVNGDGVTNVADVQLEVNMALGISSCTNPGGTCTVVSVQRVVNAALGGTCVAP